MTGLSQAAAIPEKICGVRVEPEPGKVAFERFVTSRGESRAADGQGMLG